jgi:hypothetical protein
LKKVFDILIIKCILITYEYHNDVQIITKHKHTMKTKNKRGVGRPRADVTIPKGKFTFKMLRKANKKVQPLTLRKFLKRDAARKGKSLVVMTGEFNTPRYGMGRPIIVYVARKTTRTKNTNTLKAARKSKVVINVGDAAAAILNEPTVAVIATFPDAPADPVTPEVAPVTA